MSNYEMPKAVQAYVADITGRGRWSKSGRKIPRTMKLDQGLAVEIETLAHNSGMNRNETMNKLLEIGIEAVRDELSEEERSKLYAFPPELKEKVRQLLGESEEQAA